MSTTEKHKYNSKLERKIGLVALIGLGVGATVGSGIFSTISNVAGVAGSGLFLVLAFSVGALFQIPGSFCYAELTSAYPEDGGHYVYFREAGFKVVTFICGWLTFLGLDGPAVSVMALAITKYMTVFVDWDPLVLRVLVVCLIIGICSINIRSVKAAGVFQACINYIKIIPFILIVGFGMFFIDPDLFMSTQHIADTSVSQIETSEALALFSAIALSTFSFDGMFAGCYVSGEIKNPKRTLPLGLVLAALIVLVLYLGLTSTATGLMSIDEIAASQAPIADMAAKIPVVGVYAGPIIAGVAIVVILGTISSCLLYMPRFEFAMARDGLFFNTFAKIHRKYKTPHRAISIFAVYVIILVLSADLQSLLMSLTLIILLKNCLTYCLVFYLRRKDNYNPAYKMPLRNFLPAISILATGSLFIFQLLNSSFFEIMFNVVVILLGIIAYFFWKKYNKTKN